MSERDDRSSFINSLIKIVGDRYLEIGLGTGDHFKSINTDNKDGVDILNVPVATHVMPSNEYFRQCNKTFDIVFIDGNHICEQVVMDFNNALNHLSEHGVILVHDLVPRDKTYISPAGCGDGFKMLAYFVKQGSVDMATVENSLGLTIFKSREPAKYLDIDYDYFVSGVKPLIKFVSYTDILRMLRNG